MPSLATSVTRTVTVAVDPATAFEIFTARMDAFWPREHHIGAADLAEAVLEPRAGGRWYEKGVDGSECEWGRVLAWEPPHRLLLCWQLTGEWQYDPSFETELEITFTAAPAGTTVRLEHRNLDRFGDSFEALAASLERGWGDILDRYVGVVPAG